MSMMTKLLLMLFSVLINLLESMNGHLKKQCIKIHGIYKEEEKNLKITISGTMKTYLES